jgi:ribulose-bisphosphate carboxylase large chain
MDRERIRAAYRLHVPADAALRRAQLLALEQSIEMPAEAVMDPRVLEEVAARVERIEPQADGTSVAQLSLNVESVGAEPGQLMNMLFGNSSLMPDVELIDVDVPDVLASRFGGPTLGIEGIRRLTGIRNRPLTCTALKPIGSTTMQLAALSRIFAEAGIDVIKDDHGWADQAIAPFAERVAACQRAIDEVNAARGGLRTFYAPSLFGTCTQMLRQIELARTHGIRMVLIAPMVCGVATLNGLRREHPDLAFIAHPALAGASRIAPAALLGRLFRLFGADAVIFPNHGGRFTYPRKVCEGIAFANRTPWRGLAPTLPVPAGGMSVERVSELKREYGNDCMLLIGGSLLSAREKLGERSREFVAAVAASAASVATTTNA